MAVGIICPSWNSKYIFNGEEVIKICRRALIVIMKFILMKMIMMA